MTLAILTATVWALGYLVGYWMGTLNEKSKEVQRDLEEVRENVAALERACNITSPESGSGVQRYDGSLAGSEGFSQGSPPPGQGQHNDGEEG